jgi:hypothetical protein
VIREGDNDGGRSAGGFSPISSRPNKNTHVSCGTFGGDRHYCRKAIFSDLGEVDERGYVYNFDRAGSGLTILRLTADAARVASPMPVRTR